jgi:hypothetical protein
MQIQNFSKYPFDGRVAIIDFDLIRWFVGWLVG